MLLVGSRFRDSRPLFPSLPFPHPSPSLRLSRFLRFSDPSSPLVRVSEEGKREHEHVLEREGEGFSHSDLLNPKVQPYHLLSQRLTILCIVCLFPLLKRSSFKAKPGKKLNHYIEATCRKTANERKKCIALISANVQYFYSNIQNNRCSERIMNQAVKNYGTVFIETSFFFSIFAFVFVVTCAYFTILKPIIMV